jgi:hypothetical protein
MTDGAKTFAMTTLSIMDLIMPLSINETQQISTEA